MFLCNLCEVYRDAFHVWKSLLLLNQENIFIVPLSLTVDAAFRVPPEVGSLYNSIQICGDRDYVAIWWQYWSYSKNIVQLCSFAFVPYSYNSNETFDLILHSLSWTYSLLYYRYIYILDFISLLCWQLYSKAQWRQKFSIQGSIQIRRINQCQTMTVDWSLNNFFLQKEKYKLWKYRRNTNIYLYCLKPSL